MSSYLDKRRLYLADTWQMTQILTDNWQIAQILTDNWHLDNSIQTIE